MFRLLPYSKNAPAGALAAVASATRRGPRWLPALTLVLLAACASVPTGKPEELVRQRASERWQALASGDFAKAYSYSTTAFKTVVPSDAFRSRFGAASWYGAEVISVDCPEPAKCIARVRIDFKYLMGGKAFDKISTHTDETWLLDDGQWSMFQAL